MPPKMTCSSDENVNFSTLLGPEFQFLQAVSFALLVLKEKRIRLTVDFIVRDSQELDIVV